MALPTARNVRDRLRRDPPLATRAVGRRTGRSTAPRDAPAHSGVLDRSTGKLDRVACPADPSGDPAGGHPSHLVPHDPSLVTEQHVDRTAHAEGMDLSGADDHQGLALRETSPQEAAHPVRGLGGPDDGSGDRTPVVEKKGVGHVE